ncbi:MAG: hypothetical protein IJ371_06050 [Clostridia bacterium]|nr:hypothetical protein [Clostridia bacterium]
MKFRKFVNFIAFIGIIILVVGLGLNSIPNKFGDWCHIIVDIAMWIEVSVGFIYAYYFARSREESWFMFLYGVAIISLVVMLIVRFAV